MVTVRGIMNNEQRDAVAGNPGRDQADDPHRDSVVVPTVAVQRSQSGNYVFVVKDGVAKVSRSRSIAPSRACP
jgi:hypothetical protein